MGQGSANKPQETDAPEPIGAEIMRVTRPIIVDVVVFTLIICALLIGFLGLHLLEATGYDKERVQTFETMHYWFYAGVFGLFGLDLLYKIGLALFFREQGKRK